MGVRELSRRGRSRLEVFARVRVRDGAVSAAKAAGPPGTGVRQAGRVWERYRGDARGAGPRARADGSGHDWPEGRGPRCVPMAVIGDAAGRVSCRSYGPAAASDVFGAYCRRHGVPRGLCVGRDCIYRSGRQATVPGGTTGAAREQGRGVTVLTVLFGPQR
jgi:hypothetical protein